jgi:hypothetical protein
VVPPLPWKRALGATLAIAAPVALVTARLPSAEVWADLTPAVCNEYCERSTHCGPLASRPAIQQPLNTWSNFAFLFVGLLAWRAPLRPTAALFTISCGVLAVGSFLFHATVTREFQWLDMVGTYAALIAVVARGFVAAFGVAESVAVAGALALDAFFAIFKWRIDAFIALPLLILAITVPMARVVIADRASVRAALVPVVLFAVAVLLRQLDVSGSLCSPESRVFQGHALWHVLAATALGASYFCFDGAQTPEPA